MAARRLAWVILAAATLAAAIWFLRHERAIDRGTTQAPEPAEPVPETGARPPEPHAPEAGPLDAELRAVVGEDDATAAAARLRERLRTDPSALHQAEALLLDPGTALDLRIALSVVLGTIGESDAALLQVLERDPEPDLVRAVLLGLGATREPPDDDEIFDLGDRPWGVHVGALGITVRRTIEDAPTRDALAARLAEDAPEIRLAAAKALRHSVASDDTRDAFLLALDGEKEDDVALEMGEALAGWAASASSTESQEALRRLLARAGDEGLDGYRFRLEDDLARATLGEAERARLEEYARATHPLSVRTFAVTVLAGACEKSGAVPGARQLLEAISGTDTDRAMRDTATRLLGRLPYDAGTVAHLARLSSGDPEWSVRYTAVEALAAFGSKRDVLDALTAAASDADERVAARARELLDRLGR